MFDFHKRSPWFAERYDPALADLRSRVRKVGWRGRVNQFVIDLENGKFDAPNVDEAEIAETKERSIPPEDAAGPSDAVDASIRNDDEFGMGPEGEDDGPGNAADSKPDTNGNVGLRESKNEVSVMPEGNQVMIRTIPPDIGRVKLEAVSQSRSRGECKR